MMGSKASSSEGRRAAPKEVADLAAKFNKLASGANGGFAAEYDVARSLVESNPDYAKRITRQTTDVSRRNRYGNVVTLEDTRVKLLHVQPGESDYINASLVRHLDGPETIVAQAPMSHTTQHFWQMCWERDVPLIVMLTNFDEPHGGLGAMREKSYRYFSIQKSESKSFGEFTVICEDKSSSFEGWDERKLVIIHEPTKQRKQVLHVHCTDWPDFGTLKESQLSGLHRGLHLVEHTRTAGRGPAIVHCSAGIGRSGTFVALENLVYQAKVGNWTEVDPLKVVASLRNQRPGMVQTASQYAMIYDVLLRMLQDAAC